MARLHISTFLKFNVEYQYWFWWVALGKSQQIQINIIEFRGEGELPANTHRCDNVVVRSQRIIIIIIVITLFPVNQNRNSLRMKKLHNSSKCKMQMLI